jgi:PAS domain S-box-containing protein
MEDQEKTKEQLIKELEELRQKVGEFQPTEARSAKRAETFADAREEWERTFDIIPDPISVIDREHRIVWLNKTMANRLGITPEEAVGLTCYECVHGTAEPPSFCPHTKLLSDGKEHMAELHEKRLGGHFIASVSPLYDADGRVIGSIHVARDITERRNAEEVLQKAHDRLEQRTIELVKLNEKLKQEIGERKRAEQELRKREAQLEIQTSELEEVNTALRVLLKRRNEEKTEFEEKVLYNVKELVVPYLQRLKGAELDGKRRAYVSIIESNLNDIVSSFTHKLSSKYLGLTPTEIQIANLVKQGMTTKEIAEILHSSHRTVEFHRKNIRKKIGIVNSKVNLRSHLLSM